jgi:hypothetical protein
VHHSQADGTFNIEAEAPPGQMPAQHCLATGVSPKMAAYQIGANAAAAHFRQFATIEAGQHDGAAGVADGGGNQAVKQFGVLDLVAPAKRFDDALDMAATLADVLDEVEIFVAADLLDADEQGWYPGWHGDTIANPIKSRYYRRTNGEGRSSFSTMFCRCLRNPRYSAGSPAEPRANRASWVRAAIL